MFLELLVDIVVFFHAEINHMMTNQFINQLWNVLVLFFLSCKSQYHFTKSLTTSPVTSRWWWSCLIVVSPCSLFLGYTIGVKTLLFLLLYLQYSFHVFDILQNIFINCILNIAFFIPVPLWVNGNKSSNWILSSLNRWTIFMMTTFQWSWGRCWPTGLKPRTGTWLRICIFNVY